MSASLLTAPVQPNGDIMARLVRIEATQASILSTLRRLLESLAEDDDAPALTLDGYPAGQERDQNQEL